MTKVKIGKAEYSIYYAMQPTVQSGILKRLAKVDTDTDFDAEKLEDMLSTMTELLLIGLQKFHSDKFGYNTLTGEGKEEALAKAYDLMDDIAMSEDDGKENPYFDLYNKLQTELLENGFFAKMFRQEQENAEKAEAEQK